MGLMYPTHIHYGYFTDIGAAMYVVGTGVLKEVALKDMGKWL